MGDPKVMSAERARELLDGFPAKAALSFEGVHDGAHVAVNGSFFYDHDDGDEDHTGNPIVITPGEAALYEHAPELAEAVVALHAELSAVRAALREALPDPSGQYSADGAELVSLVKLLDARHKAALGDNCEGA